MSETYSHVFKSITFMTDYLHNSDEVCTAHLQGLSSLQHTLPLYMAVPGHLHNHPTIMYVAFAGTNSDEHRLQSVKYVRPGTKARQQITPRGDTHADSGPALSRHSWSCQAPDNCFWGSRRSPTSIAGLWEPPTFGMGNGRQERLY